MVDVVSRRCEWRVPMDANEDRRATAAAPGVVLQDVVDLVTAWLPDRTALAATARFARCSAHFRSYLTSSCRTTEGLCFACGDEILCDVRRHWHAASSCGGAFVIYQGADASARYVWQPTSDRVACWPCARRLGLKPRAWRREEDRWREWEEGAEAARDWLTEVARDAA